MKTKTATVFGTLMYEGEDYISLCQAPVKLADDRGNPIERKDEHWFLVTVHTDLRDIHPTLDVVIDLYSAPMLIGVPKEKYAFIFDDPHEIVVIDDSLEEEEEPTNLSMAWSVEDILKREG